MRIITGSARGVRLKSPAGDGTRPTADRTREAVFSILGNRVVDARVLDLFAGTGALALEALSRGAVCAVLIDRATQAILMENARRTKMEKYVEIRRGDVFGQAAALARTGRAFDLIFADPPYGQGDHIRVLSAVDAGSLRAVSLFLSRAQMNLWRNIWEDSLCSVNAAMVQHASVFMHGRRCRNETSRLRREF